MAESGHTSPHIPGRRQRRPALPGPIEVFAPELANRHGHTTLAFPAISTGIFGFPPDRAARITVYAVLTSLGAFPGISEIRFVHFDMGTSDPYRDPLTELSKSGFGA